MAHTYTFTLKHTKQYTGNESKKENHKSKWHFVANKKTNEWFKFGSREKEQGSYAILHTKDSIRYMKTSTHCTIENKKKANSEDLHIYCIM